MGVVVSPGVYTTETDFSLYAPALSTSIFGVVGTAAKGPTDEVTLITDEASLINTFGNPSALHFAMYAGIRYLRYGRQLKFVRVAQYDVTAEIEMQGATLAGGALGDVGTVQAATSGRHGNLLQVIVAASTYYSGAYKFTVVYDGNLVETYDNMLTGAVNTGSANFWVTRLANGSAWVVVDSTSLDNTRPFLGVGTYTLVSGDDGAPATTADIVGSVGSPPTVPATGLQLFRNPETMDVNLLAVPGNPTAAVIAELISICEARGDAMCLIDPPEGKTVQGVADWHNGVGGGAGEPTVALNSSYAALTWPWVQVFDAWSNANLWVPPSGHVAGAIAYTDANSETWYAPAGLSRGRLVDVLDIEHSASQGERDFLYSGGNSVNPIVNFVTDGAVIWGQRTLQRTATATDRINVRRLLLYMRKVVASAVRTLVFEPNDEFTWRAFVRLVEPLCRTIKSRRGLYDFRVICDSTTNTAAVIARNEMAGNILLQPTRTAEMITVDFVLLPTGASFEEFA